MYLPHVFESAPAVTRELLRAHPFATVVGPSRDDAPEIVHVPLLVDGPEEGPIDALRLSGHVARANPFARLVASEAAVTAVFHGPDSYVSASFYGEPHEQVPTWNYAVVHVRGRLRPLDDAALTAQLTTMAERFERGTVRWQPDQLEVKFFADLRRAIVGFAIDVVDVQAKLKLSQNRSPADRERVERALGASDQPREREVAALMGRIAL